MNALLWRHYRYQACVAVWLLTLCSYSLAIQPIWIVGGDEPLVAGSLPDKAESESLAALSAQCGAPRSDEQWRPWEEYLQAFDQGCYRQAVLLNCAIWNYRQGRFLRSFKQFEESWALGRNQLQSTDPLVIASVLRAAGELAMMYSRLGRRDELGALLAAVKDLPARGAAANLLEMAQNGHALMKESPQTSYRCGPMALSRILFFKSRNGLVDPILDAQSTHQGMSLTQVADVARAVGLPELRMRRRHVGAAVSTPAVVHWKVGHYSALIREEGGRYLVEDPTFGMHSQFWISRQTLDEEASGFCLADVAPGAAGWSEVGAAEANEVWGKGQTSGADPEETGPDAHKSGGDGGGGRNGPPPCPMAQWTVTSLLVGLAIHDRPLSYAAPYGPSLVVDVRYNSRENDPFTSVPHTHLGPRWNLSLLAYARVTDNRVVIHGGHGGSELFQRDVFDPFKEMVNERSGGVLRYLGEGRGFERVARDGTREIYDQAGPTGLLYRSRCVDPFDQAMEFQFENSGAALRLLRVIDATGKITRLEYEGAGNAPVRIIDPIGRQVQLGYDAQLRLTSITDPVGIRSEFYYKGQTDFIERLITPYGETRFSAGMRESTRWLQAVHPNGDLERFEFRHFAQGIPASEPPEMLPQGMEVANNYLNLRNALHWDRKAMKEAPGDPTQARITHFLHTANVTIAGGLIESVKEPLEGRVWFRYNKQTSPIFMTDAGNPQVVQMGRVVEGGRTERTEWQYNDKGMPTRMTDPAGRITLLDYAANGLDVVRVLQQNGAGQDVLAEMTYTPQRRVATRTDATGTTLSMSYNSRGQLLSLLEPDGITRYSYAANGQIQSIDGPLPGTVDQLNFVHDDIGRPTQISDAQGFLMKAEYDAIDRLTTRRFSDGSFETWTYGILEAVARRTRSGRTSTRTFNSMRQLVRYSNQGGRDVRLEWCRCGALSGWLDSAGQLTRVRYDVQGRPTEKIYPDGRSVKWSYLPLSGRLASFQDEEGRVQSFSYAVDGNLAEVTASDGGSSLSLGRFTWDSVYPRLAAMRGPEGSTSFAYVPAGQPGAGQLARQDGPLDLDEIELAYDERGRMARRTLPGSVAESFRYDVMGRITALSNALGSMTLAYEGVSRRLSRVDLPNGIGQIFSYQQGNNTQGLLSGIEYAKDGSPLSRLQFSQRADGRISTISRAQGALAVSEQLDYDSLDRLRSWTRRDDGGVILTQRQYVHDDADNLIEQVIDGSTHRLQPNSLNQIVSVQPPLHAQAREYSWDAAGRLAVVQIGNRSSEFHYDAMGRRHRVVEKENGVVVSDRRFVYLGMELLQERDTNGNQVLKRFYSHGFESAGQKYVYGRDHLGSVRQVWDLQGGLHASYDYDPYGRRSTMSGTLQSDVGFTGHFTHHFSGLVLTHARAYDPVLGRWLSRDPSAENGGFNLYAYASNDPLNLLDPFGFEPVNYLSAGLSVVQAVGAGAGAVAGVMMISAGMAAATPALGTAAILAGTGLLIYNGVGCVVNSVQAMRKLNGMPPITGLGGENGGDFQFNPVTETLHYAGLGGRCNPIAEVSIQAGGVLFDTVIGMRFTAWIAPTASAAMSAGVADMLGNAGSIANMIEPGWGGLVEANDNIIDITGAWHYPRLNLDLPDEGFGGVQIGNRRQF